MFLVTLSSRENDVIVSGEVHKDQGKWWFLSNCRNKLSGIKPKKTVDEAIPLRFNGYLVNTKVKKDAYTLVSRYLEDDLDAQQRVVEDKNLLRMVRDGRIVWM